MLQRTEYPSSLTEQQWELIKDLIPKSRRGGRPRTTDVQKVIEAIFYLNRTGCAWRYLPKEFPKWQTVYDYFSRWTVSGVFEHIRATLTTEVRMSQNHHPVPSQVIVDSQSARAHYGEERGWDGFKKVRGRKRHILVDTMGTILDVKITSAQLSDQKPGMDLLYSQAEFLRQRKLHAVYADGGYRSWFEYQVFGAFRIWPTILKGSTRLKKNEDPKFKGKRSKIIATSNLAPKRWIVERTFAWLNHYRRLSRDYERKISHSEAMIRIAMSQILIRKLMSSA